MNHPTPSSDPLAPATPPMPRLARAAYTARALLAAHYANLLEYRAEILLWAISGSLPLIMAGLWIEIAQSNPAAFSWSPDEYPRYFFCGFIVRQLTLVWVVWEFEQDVVTGRLSHYLLQPLDPGWRHVAEHLAERIARIPVLLLLGLAFFLIFPQSIWTPAPLDVVLALLAITVTFIMRFIVQYAFAMLAFWTERAHQVERLWYLPYFFLSGLVVPVAEFPESVRTVIAWTPFPYLIDFPASILMGRGHDIAFGFAITLAWAAIFWFIHRLLWKAGLRHYSAMGA